MAYRAIITNAERQRNNRVKELLANRTKVHHASNKPPQTKILTQEQMDKVNELREQGMSREEAVKMVLDNTK